MIITLLVVYVLGYFTYPIVTMLNDKINEVREKKKQEELEAKKHTLLRNRKVSEIISKSIRDSKKPKTKKSHLEPKYHGYEGGYDLLTKCSNCGMTALYEDQHPTKPCHFCGGDVKIHGAGRWEKINGEFQWNMRKALENLKDKQQ
jgi:hypothetical protein